MYICCIKRINAINVKLYTGGYLAVINSEEEQNDIFKYLGDLESLTWIWIGFSDEVVEGDWRWV